MLLCWNGLCDASVMLCQVTKVEPRCTSKVHVRFHGIGRNSMELAEAVRTESHPTDWWACLFFLVRTSRFISIYSNLTDH